MLECFVCDGWFPSEKSLSKHHSDVHELFDGYEDPDEVTNEETKDSKATPNVENQTNERIEELDIKEEFIEDDVPTTIPEADQQPQIEAVLFGAPAAILHEMQTENAESSTKQGSNNDSDNAVSVVKDELESDDNMQTDNEEYTPQSKEDKENVEKKKNFSCDTCDKRFATYKYLQTHFYQVHRGYLFECDKCQKTFKTNSHLKYHLRQHEKVMIPCKECNKTFLDKSGLTKHVKVVHQGIRLIYKCKLCDEEFNSSGSLFRHRKKMHSIEKEYNCEQCSYSTFVKVHFKTHQNQHKVL